MLLFIVDCCFQTYLIDDVCNLMIALYSRDFLIVAWKMIIIVVSV